MIVQSLTRRRNAGFERNKPGAAIPSRAAPHFNRRYSGLRGLPVARRASGDRADSLHRVPQHRAPAAAHRRPARLNNRAGFPFKRLKTARHFVAYTSGERRIPRTFRFMNSYCGCKLCQAREAQRHAHHSSPPTFFQASENRRQLARFCTRVHSSFCCAQRDIG